MISNLYDFTPDDIVTHEKMHPIDRLACVASDDWVERVRKHYDAFDLHDAYLAIVDFGEVDLSSFYFDALKDPLYCELPDSARRRSAQSAIYHIFKNFEWVLAPLLSFTSEEAWQFLPEPLRGQHESVFDLEPPKTKADPQALGFWNLVKELRAKVAANEQIRDYDARAEVRAGGEVYAVLRAFGDDLREALEVSALTLIPSEGEGATLELDRADGQKCQRCRKILELGIDPKHPTLCAHCAQTVNELDTRRT